MSGKNQQNTNKSNSSRAAAHNAPQNTNISRKQNTSTKADSESPIQMQADLEGEGLLQGKFESSPKQSSSTSSTTSTGLPGTVQAKMEKSFNTSFSDVKITKDSSKAKNIGAKAYTQGSSIHFAPGKFDPNTTSGQELIGHELTHVVQQKQGRVTPSIQGKFQNINTDSSLEKEADHMGARAAAGLSVSMGKITENATPNGSTQFAIESLKDFKNKTHAGFFARRSGDVSGIDKLITEYVRIKKAKGYDPIHIAVNKENLERILGAIARYINRYIDDKGGKNKRSKKFQEFLNNDVKEEKDILKNSEKALTDAVTADPSIKPEAPMKSEAADFEAKLVGEDEKTENAKNKPGAEEEQEGFDPETQELEIAAMLDGALSLPTDIALDDINDNNSYSDDKIGNEDALAAAGDSLAFVKSMIGLGTQVAAVFGDSASPDEIKEMIIDLTGSIGSGVETTANMASHIAGAAGDSGTQDITGTVGSAAEGFNAFFEIMSDVIRYFIKKNKTVSVEEEEEEKEQDEIASLKKHAKTQERLEMATKAIGYVRSGFMTAKAIFDAVGSAATAGSIVGNVVPGLDIAISTISIVSQGIDLWEASVSAYKMRKLKLDAQKQLIEKMKKKEVAGNIVPSEDKVYIEKLNDAMKSDKNLRARKANLQLLYNEDTDKLTRAGVNKKKKEEILIRRDNTREAIEMIDGQLKENPLASSGIEKGDEDYGTFNVASDLQSAAHGKIFEKSVGIGIELTKIIASILSFIGPAGPAGMILKGVATGVQFAMAGGKAVRAYGRDKAGRANAMKMIDEVSKNGKGAKLESVKQSGMTSMFDETKSAAAQVGEKKHHHAIIVNNLAKFPSDTVGQLKATESLKNDPAKQGAAIDKIKKKANSTKSIVGAYGINMDKLLAVNKGKQAKYLAQLLMEA